MIIFLQTQGYTLNLEKGKNPHSLDSWVFWYTNTAGNKDNIKVDINYSMRAHILQIIEMPIRMDFLEASFPINTLSPLELFGTKIKALIERNAARDLYDVDKMVYYGIFEENELSILKKCILFYCAVGSSKELNLPFNLNGIDYLNWGKIRQTLLPMLRRSEHFDLNASQKRVKTFLTDLLLLTTEEIEFIQRFKNKEYIPELLFDDENMINAVKTHPMALWKMRE